MLKKSPHILITTLESIAIIINSPKFVEKFTHLESIIIDEIYSLAENKRDARLNLTIERLFELSIMPIVNIRLSVSIALVEKVVNYLINSKNDCCGDKN
jgi:ATP-dependent Lhr-like helicase